MRPATTRDASYPSRRLSLVGTVLVVVVLAGAGAGIWDRRREAIAQSGREATDLAFIFAVETARAVASVDPALRDIDARLGSLGARDPRAFETLPASEGIRDFLRRRGRLLPQADLMALIAADGRLVDGSRSRLAAAADLSKRDFFAYLRSHDDARPYVGALSVAPGTGIRSLLVARRLSAADGRFLGVAVIAIDVDRIARSYRSIVAPMGGSVGLFRRDGSLLAGGPRGRTDRRSVLRRGIGGNRALVALQPVGALDLAVAISLPEATALADWRRHSAVIAVGAILVALVFALLFRALAGRSLLIERSEAELRESEARFREFALTSSDWFWETDAEHRFVYQSEQIREFGQDPQKRLGRLRVDLAADVESEPEKWREHMAVLNRHEPFRDFVYERRVGADPPHFISVSGNPAFDAAGRFLGYRGTARNITDEVLAARSLRAAKAAAEAANLAKSHFLANISHELRTPLNAILGFSELLERGAGGPIEPHGREYAGLIRQSGAHLLGLINDLLDLARIDAGKLELREERGIDPRRLVEHCLELLRPQADAAGLRLSVAIAEPVPLLLADRTRLTEIILNLLSNAIKFTEPPGTVALTLRQGSAGEVLFEVRDSGIGMTGAEIEIALEPFGQVDPGLGRRSPGTGLGLPLARRLAELHGGSLDIESERGAGTTATLRLPAARVVADAAAAIAASIAAFG